MMNGRGDNNIMENEILTPVMKKRIEWIMIGFMTLCFALAGVAQEDQLKELNFEAESEFEPSIKDAIKFKDLPEIRDTVKRIKDIKYSIRSFPMFPKYEVAPIEAAKLQNEPLNKLYHALLKVGYGFPYNMPLAELSISNERSRNQSLGARITHLSSGSHLRDGGYSGFSDNSALLFGKRFYRKHTLSGDLGFSQNALHYYGFDTSAVTPDDRSLTSQRYRLIEPRLRLLSHYTDSSHINHDVNLGFYHLQNMDREMENNIRARALGTMFVNKEKLNIDFLADFYNHKQAHDTLNNLIVTVNPSFEAQGKKWHANIGVAGTIDHFREKTRFYFYPMASFNYDVYESLIIPYAGVSGGLIKNSMRSLTTENPFVDTTMQYVNTNNRYRVFAGLRGNISSHMSYDAQVKYSQLDSLHYFVINYSDANPRDNRFSVIYDNTRLVNVSGELTYHAGERLNLIGKGNYYLYKPASLQRPYHRPDFDMTLSGIYNLRSKIIVRADLFIFGKQFARRPVMQDTVITFQPQLISGWFDANLEAEYRYSKMMSFFVRFNNIANQRYYRWDRYASQRLNVMIGLTFVPF